MPSRAVQLHIARPTPDVFIGLDLSVIGLA